LSRSPRLTLHPGVIVWWSGGQAVLRHLDSGATLPADAALLAVLAAFARPIEMGRVVGCVAGLEPEQVRARARALRRHGMLVSDEQARRVRSRLDAWKGNAASALHHAASRDLRYVSSREDAEAAARERASSRRPARSKSYRAASVVALPGSGSTGASLETVLESRRTVRKFRRTAVPFADFAAVVRGTFGETGTHDGGPFGRLLTKTSPSAGSLHPIECYAIAWNVSGLAPGIYHYDVARDDLRRLRRGRFARHAVRAASGQSWVAGAGFACVLTAVIERSLWKYDDELTYRTLWLDAGHLAQTFCLLATARGLGPFTTAAIQDSYIEKLIGLDGAREFPLYLCGAGVPASTRVR